MSVRETIDPKSSLWSWLAFDLWFYRNQRSMSLAQTAMLARVARGTVSNWEAGRLRPGEKSMRLLDEAWDTGGHFERLHMFACAGHNPDWLRQYVQYEQTASMIKAYHGKCIPLLVQTEAYARSVLLAAGKDEQAEALTSARMKRQELLHRKDPPWLWILIDQEALEVPVGGNEVMREQLAHLRKVSGLFRVSIRIVPRSAGPHPGHEGPFQVLSVHGRLVAYAGARSGGRLIETGDEAEGFVLAFDQIGHKALPAAASDDLIGRTMAKYA